ncbi:32932_t:CDS:2, partial [Racocetra persica]
PYSPAGRTELMSELVSDKVYYFGGYGINGAMNEFFYIDLTQPFYSFSPTYQFIKYLDFRGGASAISDANNIYVFGGYGSSGSPIRELYIIQQLFSADPVINYIQDTSSTPPMRKWHTSVIDHTNKKMYVWGGVKSLHSGPDITQGDGTMYIYDIEKSIWTSNPTPNQPIGRQLHTATFLPDGRIIMIGGAFSSDVGQLDVYDTKTNQWSNIVATTNNGVIPPIIFHSATLLPDNQSIIIYGGSNQTGYSGLAVLNLSSYVWTIISPIGRTPPLVSSGHKATLYFDVIIFAFGEFPFNNSRYLIDNTVRILNISNGQYRWKNRLREVRYVTESNHEVRYVMESNHEVR